MKIYEKEYFATSEDEALDKAATHFDVAKDQLEIRKLDGVVIEGLSDRQCYVVAVQGMADKQPEATPRSEGRGRDRDRGGRDRDRGRGRDRDRGGRDRDRGRGRDRDRGGRDRGRGRRPRGDKPEGVDHEHFEAIAQEAVNCVLEDGEDVVLDAMNSKERWVVHNFIKNIDGVSSESEGEGAERKIRVFEVEDDDDED